MKGLAMFKCKDEKNTGEDIDYVACYLVPWNNPRNKVPRKEWHYELIKRTMRKKRDLIFSQEPITRIPNRR